MIGIILAAGAGSRLFPLTRDIPKTLLELASSTAVLDVSVGNLAAVGVDEVLIVAGENVGPIEERVVMLEDRFDLDMSILQTDRDSCWNNAYSLWLARDWFTGGAVIVNGDTVHPVSVERGIVAAQGAGVTLAIDRHSRLGAEAMKVQLDDDGEVTAIGKHLDSRQSSGEFIGVSIVSAECASEVATALRQVFEQDKTSWYEDGYDRYRRGGGPLTSHDIGVVEWVEIDTPADLEAARRVSWLE